MNLPLWPWRKRPAPSRHASLLALAAAVLDHQPAFGSLPFAVTLAPTTGEVIASACLPCGFVGTAMFSQREGPGAVAERMSRLLAGLSCHEHTCGPRVDCGPFEVAERRAGDER